LKAENILKEYVSRLEEACGEEKDYIVILRLEKRNEALKKILSKGETIRSFSQILTKIRFKGKILNVFKTGKLVVKDVKSKEELEVLLSELLA